MKKFIIIFKSFAVAHMLMVSIGTFAQNIITYPPGEFKGIEKVANNECVEDPFICKLLKTYAPKFIFHPNEKYHPSTVDFFVKHSSLRYRYSKKNSKEILPLGEVTLSNLGQQIHGMNGTQTMLDVGKHQPSFRKSRSRGEYYVAVADKFQDHVFAGFAPETFDEQLVTYANFGRLYKAEVLMGYQLQYWLFYPYNGSIGYHEGDWEGVSVTVDLQGQFVFATYMSHGRSHTYFPEQIIFADSVGAEQPSELQLPDDIYSHPVVFSSKAMHASYPDEKIHRRWAFIIPLPSDRTKRGAVFNSFNRVQLLPNRFMATGNLKWVQFAGRWGGRKSNMFNSPDGAAYKRPYYRGTWFRPETKRKMRDKANAIGSKWGRLRYEPRIPVCDEDNRWLMLVSRNDLREQYFAELYRRDDPVQKYHNLDLYNFDNVITGVMECSSEYDTYLLFDDINFGGKKRIVEPWNGPGVLEKDRIEGNDRVSSLCWERCDESNWVSFFKNKGFKGTSYFLNGELNTEVADFNETNLPGGEISSVRYCIPDGYKLVLYDQPGFATSEFMLEIKGTGSFGEIDFIETESQMQDLIQSARIVPDPMSN